MFQTKHNSFSFKKIKAFQFPLYYLIVSIRINSFIHSLIHYTYVIEVSIFIFTMRCEIKIDKILKSTEDFDFYFIFPA